MASFGSVNFNEKGNNAASFPVFDRQALNTYKRPPGGSRIIKQKSGQVVDTLALNVQCTGAQLTSLRGVVDSEATLTWSGGTRYCSLDAIGGAQRLGVGDLFLCTLQFTGL